MVMGTEFWLVELPLGLVLWGFVIALLAIMYDYIRDIFRW